MPSMRNSLPSLAPRGSIPRQYSGDWGGCETKPVIVQGNIGEAEEFVPIRCIDWLQKRGLEVNQELWDGLYELALHAKRSSVRLRARQMLVDRIDPIPRAPAIALETGPVSITWAPVPSESPTPPAPFSSNSTTPSGPRALEQRASSAIDALENL
jgi:hypothetical protein